MLGGNSQTDVAAFLAGYTAAMITDDYRIGMLMPKDNADALTALNSYATGMSFYCGPAAHSIFILPRFLNMWRSAPRKTQ